MPQWIVAAKKMAQHLRKIGIRAPIVFVSGGCAVVGSVACWPARFANDNGNR